MRDTNGRALAASSRIRRRFGRPETEVEHPGRLYGCAATARLVVNGHAQHLAIGPHGGVDILHNFSDRR